MLELTSHITIDEDTIASPNLCDYFSEDDLKAIGQCVHEEYIRDLESRRTWYKRAEAAMDLAMQVQKIKTFPWQNCSNVDFPLITIAALQFHARAYPAIVNGRKVVDCKVVGNDPDGIIRGTADKIASHMSWQLLEQDSEWEAEQDRALINLPIVGVAFKKTYFDPSKGHNVSCLVMAKDFVLDYFAKSVENCATKTHVIPMYRNDIHEGVMRGIYYDVLETDWFKADAQPYQQPNKEKHDKRAGMEEPVTSRNTPFTLLEQHCSMDLDGDGYDEPYIVTIEESTQTVLRIVTRFNRIEDIEYNSKKQIIKIKPMEYFTKLPFIPNPDGSIMDLGFGTLLGPLNESVNATINQIFDAGTMANTAGGFLGRGAKIRGGLYKFNPFEWNRVDSTGDDLRKSMFPLPVREPSSVMFQLLGFLIEYTNRISGTTEMMVGENPGQNTPAETARTMVEQGTKIYSAIYKRVWRAMKEEFKKLYTLNQLYLPDKVAYGNSGDSITRDDYAVAGAAVCPVADPLVTSDGARFAQARMIAERAATVPGYNTDATERRFLQALLVDDPESLFVGTEGQPPTVDIKIQIQQLKNEAATQKLQFEQQKFVATLQQTSMMNSAQIEKIQAEIFKIMEQGKAEPEKNRINAFNAAIQALREQNQQNAQQIQTMQESMKNESGTNAGTGTISGVASASNNSGLDPLGFPQEGGA